MIHSLSSSSFKLGMRAGGHFSLFIINMINHELECKYINVGTHAHCLCINVCQSCMNTKKYRNPENEEHKGTMDKHFIGKRYLNTNKICHNKSHNEK